MSVPSGSAGGLQPVLEHLGLHQAADVLTEWLDRAAAQELGYADFLQGLLEEESTARANAATQKRLHQAGFPFAATLDQFDFRFRPELKRQVVLRYLDPTFIEQARSLALIPPPGSLPRSTWPTSWDDPPPASADSGCSDRCWRATCWCWTNSAICRPCPVSVRRCTS